MSETRKIAAILVSDVVGYSRLAGADEDRILARLRGLRSDLIDPTIAVHNGRIVKRTGDGNIVEFRSVVDAVRCAIEVQNAMVERNAGVPPERRIEFRIGIHLGDIVEESDGDLMGDGVNIAARLEGVCEPGGICLSSAAYEQVRDKLKREFVDLGEKQLKNIARPVRAYALSAAAIAASADQQPSTRPATVATAGGRARWAALIAACGVAALAAGWFGWRTRLPSQTPAFSAASDALKTVPRLSIVVLPFENLSGDKEQDYFADGITDDLTTDLSHLPDSFVIARNTAFTYKGKAVDAKQVGHELGVRYVLEGSVRRVGENITVNAQLISTETGTHVWADRFDGERSKFGQLQVDIVARLANSLNVALVRAESLRALRERPNNPDAVDLAMRGWAAIYRGQSKANVQEAIDKFEQALRIDSQQPEALVGLSVALNTRVSNFDSANLAEDADRAGALASQALSANPDNAYAHLTKAVSVLSRSLAKEPVQWGTAIAEAEAAIADDRNLAGAYAVDGLFKVFLGRAAEGISSVETALRLSPRDPDRASWEFQMCHLYMHMAQLEQAIEWCRKSIASDPMWWAFADVAAASAFAGRDAEARAAVADLLKLQPGFTVQQWMDFNSISDNETFQRGNQRIGEGLRKAGLSEQ
jgi:TolB-like protein/class 3 adenylate cyclase